MSGYTNQISQWNECVEIIIPMKDTIVKKRVKN